MRKIIYTLTAILLMSKLLFSQDYAKVDRIVQNYARSFSSPDKLAKQINKDFTLPTEKARAIYTWIALHIKYDIEALRRPQKRTSFSYRTLEEKAQKEREIMEGIAKQTLKKKKAVCQGYSSLYKLLCDLSSIECEIITGFAKINKRDIGRLPRGSNHAWNAVRINNEWKLIDVTWGAGYINENSSQFTPDFKEHYFFLSPEKFVLKHYPEDKAWLFTTISANQFAKLPLFFSSYFDSNIEIVKPNNGIIKAGKTINFKVKNLGNDTLTFKFDYERNSQRIKPKQVNGFSIFEIEHKRNVNTYLTVFRNRRAFAKFKISKR
ncbi:MAG: hypothetical protein MI739_03150 [Bacteroidales bacterium]|nr:hypothetical protein [Bacteroidales bacterium]